MLSAYEIQRSLRLITSASWKREKRFPIALLANLAGVHRSSIYLARDGYYLTERVVAVLSPLLEAIVAGRLIAKRYGKLGRCWRVEER
jgi:hypothetical protein